MDLSGKHVAVLVDNYFEQSEFKEPVGAMKDAGAEVTVISTKEKEVWGMIHAELGDKFSVDLIIDQAESGDYDALIIPGGVINADKLRMNEIAQAWATDFLSTDRPLAIICHAPWLLVSANSIKGRRLTSYYTIQDDIRNAGAEWVDLDVVIDENLITSRNPNDLPNFNKAIIKMLSGKSTTASANVIDMPYVVSEDKLEEDIRLRSLGYSEEQD